MNNKGSMPLMCPLKNPYIYLSCKRHLNPQKEKGYGKHLRKDPPYSFMEGINTFSLEIFCYYEFTIKAVLILMDCASCLDLPWMSDNTVYMYKLYYCIFKSLNYFF